MKRNPVEIKKDKYFTKKLKFREVTPRFAYCQCKRCGNEFEKEPMYWADDGLIWSGWYGCKECFSSVEKFKAWLGQEGYILTEEDFENGDWRLEFI